MLSFYSILAFHLLPPCFIFCIHSVVFITLPVNFRSVLLSLTPFPFCFHSLILGAHCAPVSVAVIVFVSGVLSLSLSLLFSAAYCCLSGNHQNILLACECVCVSLRLNVVFRCLLLSDCCCRCFDDCSALLPMLSLSLYSVLLVMPISMFRLCSCLQVILWLARSRAVIDARSRAIKQQWWWWPLFLLAS